MPKVEKNVGDDPDPAEWLFISLEQKRIDQSKPYDAKKACWVPDEALGYILGEIKSTKGELVSVSLPGGEVISQPMNDNLFSHAIIQKSWETFQDFVDSAGWPPNKETSGGTAKENKFTNHEH